ncbi:uncharacterized protein TNCV_358881 [Trichonephila clavipes]|nr:uncharacterized protein TNCV_358881 [Trichonephila clavipes]
MRYIGQGISSLETFCSLMCLPNPVSQKAYDRINAKIADISEALANASMKKAAAEEKIIDGTVNSIVISGYGTWKTHGHTSLIGVCALIGADCGKVLDMEVMSSYCKGCDSYKGPKFGLKCSAFLAKHQIFCRKNHNGSAGGMEVCGMQKIFFRSEQKHGLKYQRYVGDGYSKTFSSIAEKKPYEDSVPIEKIECVGHVQKRMGSRLRKLKALWGEKKLSDGKTIGGKGRLTDAIISKLTTFYDNAIRANSHNVNEMSLHAEIVEVEMEVVSPSIVPSGNFTELKSHCHLYGAQGQDLARATMNFVGLDLTTSDRTATASSDVVQPGRPIFDDFFQHLWPYIGNNTANVVFQMVKRLWLIRIDQ